MDKYEYRIRAEEIHSLIEKREFAQAMKIADTIDWRRVRSVSMLCKISELYKINRKYEESKEVLLLAYDLQPGSRKIVYSLCELSIKLEEIVQAVEYYKEFSQLAPRDSGRFILQYRLYEAQDVSLEERIAVLEEYKKRDYREKWAYELAYLYHRIGLATRCVEECDELILWFGEGKYVLKAMELKMLHAPLSLQQQEKYNARFMNKAEEEEESTEEQSSTGVEIEPSMSIEIKSVEATRAKTARIPTIPFTKKARAGVNVQDEQEDDIITQVRKYEESRQAASEEPEEEPEEAAETAAESAQLNEEESVQEAASKEEVQETEAAAEETEAADDDDLDIKIKPIDVNDQYSTINLQEVLKKDLEKLFAQEDMEADDATRALPLGSIFQVAGAVTADKAEGKETEEDSEETIEAQEPSEAADEEAEETVSAEEDEEETEEASAEEDEEETEEASAEEDEEEAEEASAEEDEEEAEEASAEEDEEDTEEVSAEEDEEDTEEASAEEDEEETEEVSAEEDEEDTEEVSAEEDEEDTEEASAAEEAKPADSGIENRIKEAVIGDTRRIESIFEIKRIDEDEIEEAADLSELPIDSDLKEITLEAENEADEESETESEAEQEEEAEAEGEVEQEEEAETEGEAEQEEEAETESEAEQEEEAETEGEAEQEAEAETEGEAEQEAEAEAESEAEQEAEAETEGEAEQEAEAEVESEAEQEEETESEAEQSEGAETDEPEAGREREIEIILEVEEQEPGEEEPHEAAIRAEREAEAAKPKEIEVVIEIEEDADDAEKAEETKVDDGETEIEKNAPVKEPFELDIIDVSPIVRLQEIKPAFGEVAKAAIETAAEEIVQPQEPQSASEENEEPLEEKPSVNFIMIRPELDEKKETEEASAAETEGESEKEELKAEAEAEKPQLEAKEVDSKPEENKAQAEVEEAEAESEAEKEESQSEAEEAEAESEAEKEESVQQEVAAEEPKQIRPGIKVEDLWFDGAKPAEAVSMPAKAVTAEGLQPVWSNAEPEEAGEPAKIEEAEEAGESEELKEAEEVKETEELKEAPEDKEIEETEEVEEAAEIEKTEESEELEEAEEIEESGELIEAEEIEEAKELKEAEEDEEAEELEEAEEFEEVEESAEIEEVEAEESEEAEEAEEIEESEASEEVEEFEETEEPEEREKAKEDAAPKPDSAIAAPMFGGQNLQLPEALLQAVQNACMEAAKQAASEAAKEAAEVAAKQAQEATQAAQEAAQAIKEMQPQLEKMNTASAEPEEKAEEINPVEKQITGQLSFDDIMAEWEKTNKENEEKHIEEMKARVTQQTGSLLSPGFESSASELSMISPAVDVFSMDSKEEQRLVQEVEDALKEDLAEDTETAEPVSQADREAEKKEELMDAAKKAAMQAAQRMAADKAAKQPPAAPVISGWIEDEPEEKAVTFNTAEIKGLEEKLVTSLDSQHYDTSKIQPDALEEIRAVYDEEQSKLKSDAAAQEAAKLAAASVAPTAFAEIKAPVYEEAKAEPQKPEMPAAEPIKTEETKTEAPIAQPPKTEPPKPEEQKAAEPAPAKAEAPKPEPQKAEEAKPEPVKVEPVKEVPPRMLTTGEKDIFGQIAQTKEAQMQIARTIDLISFKPLSGNVIITGDAGTAGMDTAKGIVKNLSYSNSNKFSGSVAIYTGDGLTKINLDKILGGLSNGALIVNEAGSLDKDFMDKLLDSVNNIKDSGLLIILVDQKSKMDRLKAVCPRMKAHFPGEINIETLDNNGLVKFGKEYARQKDYSIDEMGVLALYNRIEERQTIDHIVTIDEVKAIVDAAIERSEKKNLPHFMDVVFGKRYDREDLIVLKEKDFLED